MTDGPHATEEERALGWTGPGGGERAGARKPGRGKEKESGPVWAGKREGEKEKPSHFLKRFKLFQFKFKPKDLNLN